MLRHHLQWGMSEDYLKFGLVCVQNAGRSQMSAAFAERERQRRRLEDKVEKHTGDTHPADEVHPKVVEAMQELNIDLSDRVPPEVSTAALNECDVILTMGCSTLELDAAVEIRDWALDDPHSQDIDRVREIRAEIEARVTSLFDEFFDDE